MDEISLDVFVPDPLLLSKERIQSSENQARNTGLPGLPPAFPPTPSAQLPKFEIFSKPQDSPTIPPVLET